jgi:manganese-dependent inorganic pyrophosphatase
MDTIYIAGHKSPDLDSVIGTIAYAYLKNKTDTKNSYIPIVVGDLNLETEYVLEKFELKTPIHMDSVAGKKIILVDHNEAYQAIDGLEGAEILEIIDHHKMNFSYNEPIRIIIEPIGSSCNVISKMFKADDVVISKNLAGAMLAATLTDTILTKSPTTTDEDVRIIEELTITAGIEDWKTFGMEIFKVRSSVSKKSDGEIIVSDYKDFDFNGKKFGIGQVETVDIKEFDDRKPGLLRALSEKRTVGKYHSTILFLTDIIKEESHFLVASEDPEKIASAFGQKNSNGTFIAPVVSRKKQVVPMLSKNV